MHHSNLSSLKSRSASKTEFVLEFADAMELLDILENDEIIVHGWEGWIRRANGELGHSIEHQGTIDLSNLPSKEAIEFAKSTISKSNVEWQKNPEVRDAELLFCITADT